MTAPLDIEALEVRVYELTEENDALRGELAALTGKATGAMSLESFVALRVQAAYERCAKGCDDYAASSGGVARQVSRRLAARIRKLAEGGSDG